MPLPFPAARYHSLCVDAGTLPAEFTVSALADDGVVMGIRHKTLPIEGVQFHPGVGADAGRSAHPRPLPAPLRRRRAGDPRVAARLLLQGDGGMSEIVRAALAQVCAAAALTQAEAHAAMGEVMDGEATPAQLAGLLLALRMRGEKADELAGFALAMRERVLAVDAPAGARSTRAARAAMARGRSTFRPQRRWWWPQPGCPWPSTATGR